MYLHSMIILVATVTFSLVGCNQMNENPGNTEYQGKIENQSVEASGLLKEIIKREANEAWMVKEFVGNEDIMKIHAFIVRDENIPPCCESAKQVSNNRYFMCTGAVLTLRHAITTASCMHFADVYEHHINANLALQVGGVTSPPYVIRINRYEMHPKYVFDIEAKDQSTHNLAILFLECSIIPEVVIVPHLPRGVYDDIGHMCCGKNCDVITIVQTPENRQFARILKAKNLPSPRHDPIMKTDSGNSLNLDAPRLYKKSPSDKTVPMRQIRSTGKRAPPPTFNFRNTRSENNTESSKKILKPQNSRRRKKNKNSTEINAESKTIQPLSNEIGGRRQAVPQTSINSSKIDGDPNSVDWDKVQSTMIAQLSDMNKSSMEKFAEDIVDETMKRLKNAIEVNNGLKSPQFSTGNTNTKTTSGFLTQLLSNTNGNRSIDDIARAFSTVITRMMPQYKSDNLLLSPELDLNADDLPQPPPKYVKCPPLGTPIIIENTLVGMIAYTCDDAQSWVEWKYVSLSKNLIWIGKRITATEHHGKPTDCSSPLDNWKIDHDELEPRLRTGLGWHSQNPLNQRLTYDEYLKKIRDNRRFGDDVMFNSTLDPGRPRSIGTEHEKTMRGGNFPVGNGNTCYTRADGSTDCRSIPNTYTRQ